MLPTTAAVSTNNHNNSSNHNKMSYSLSCFGCRITMRQIQQLMGSFAIFCVGWYGPSNFLIPSESSILSKPIPAQSISLGGNNDVVVLDFRYNQPLTEPPMFPCKSYWQERGALFLVSHTDLCFCLLAAFLLILTSVQIPFLVILVSMWYSTRTAAASSSSSSHKNLHHLPVCAFLSAVGLSESCTNLLKFWVQRFRPNFFALCGYNYSNANAQATLGEVCSAPFMTILEGQLSFPSGHTSLSFCTMTILVWHFYYTCCCCCWTTRPLASCFSSGSNSSGVWWSWVFWIYSTIVGVSRIVDQWHHPSDVLAGCLLGTTAATIAHFCWYGHRRDARILSNNLSGSSSLPSVTGPSPTVSSGIKLPSFHD